MEFDGKYGFDEALKDVKGSSALIDGLASSDIHRFQAEGLEIVSDCLFRSAMFLEGHDRGAEAETK